MGSAVGVVMVRGAAGKETGLRAIGVRLSGLEHEIDPGSVQTSRIWVNAGNTKGMIVLLGDFFFVITCQMYSFGL